MHYKRIANELVKEILAEASRREWSRLELDERTDRWAGYWSAVKAGRKRFEIADVIDAARVFGTSPSQLLVRAEFRTEPALLERPASPDFERRVVEELGVLSARIRRVEEQSPEENGG